MTRYGWAMCLEPSVGDRLKPVDLIGGEDLLGRSPCNRLASFRYLFDRGLDLREYIAHTSGCTRLLVSLAMGFP